jgi:hypothetical protein
VRYLLNDFQQRGAFFAPFPAEKKNSVLKQLTAPSATASKFGPLPTTVCSKKKAGDGGVLCALLAIRILIGNSYEAARNL